MSKLITMNDSDSEELLNTILHEEIIVLEEVQGS